MIYPNTRPISHCRRWSSAAAVRARRSAPADTQSIRASRFHRSV